MKQKVNTEILMEALNNKDTFKGHCGNHLLGSYIGSVEVVVDKTWDYWDGVDYITEYYLAIQLPSGKILGIKEDNTAFSLANQDFIIHWNSYPIGFPEEKKTKRPCPEKLKRWEHVPSDYSGIAVETTEDELPF